MNSQELIPMNCPDCNLPMPPNEQFCYRCHEDCWLARLLRIGMIRGKAQARALPRQERQERVLTYLADPVA